MKRFLLLPVLVLVLLATLFSTGVLEQRSWAGSEARPSGSLTSNFLLLLTGSEPITAIAGASPTSGTVPLTVQFTTNSSGPVETWRWDFDGDGTWEWEGNTPEDRPYTYHNTGAYTAVLQVEDVDGNTDDTQVGISVNSPPPAITFSADDNQIIIGQSTLLQWTVTGATTVSIDQGVGTVNADDTQVITPLITTLYTLTATGPGGTSTAEVEVRVVEPFAVYINTPTDGQTVSDDSLTVSGTVSRATARVWVNSVEAVVTGLTFSVELSLAPAYNAILATASDSGETVSDSSWVVNDYTYAPQPEGSFGDQYEDLVPADAAVPTYDKDRFAVITGFVEDEQSSPVQGATVTIKNHPEYGTSQTDTTGSFSLPVEGGTDYTVVYRHTSYLTAHRKVEVLNNDIAIVDLVRLVIEDSTVTTVVFDGNPDAVVTHISSVTTDSSGSRAMTMVFQGDNLAWEVDEQGQRIRELTSIETRATEFSTPEAMPSVLPPNSAFTYCAELSVDGVKRVQFDKPVATYVDNFIGFDVGMAVPVGYYDRDKGEWVAADNGVVVRLLDTNSDGVVDALDADGDSAADDLNGSGSFEDEVTGLQHDPVQYAPGSTFWRVEVSHFTPWDHNWPYGPPLDAEDPNPEDEPKVDEREKKPKDDCDDQFASSIEARSRVYREDIVVPGTDLQLHYTSSRVPGYKTVINIPVSGASVHEDLKSILLRIKIAGRTFNHTLPAAINQEYAFVWDGLDYRGDAVMGHSVLAVDIGFVYKAVYYSPGDFARAFAQAGSVITALEARKEVVIWRHWLGSVHSKVNSGKTLAAGWTLSSHHTSQSSAILLKGNGDITQLSGNIIDTIAGNGGQGFSGDGGPATNASFDRMKGVAIDVAGNIYLVDVVNNRIRKIDTSGMISTIIGDGVSGHSGDGGPAVNARIAHLKHITIDTVGNIYFNEIYNNVVRKIDTNGIVTTVAGINTGGTNGGYSGDNGPATEAQLNQPGSLAVDTEGNLYINDLVNGRIRKVSSDGIITTVAAISGDDITVDSEGNIYVARGQHIRKIDQSGSITIIAGTGGGEFSGDGGPATSAAINAYSIAVDATGKIYLSNDDYFATNKTSRVRVIDTSGIITTFAGTGYGFGGDGGPATDALFGFIYDVVIDAEGNLLVSDTLNNSVSRLRKITLTGADFKSFNGTFYPDENGLGYRFTEGGQHLETMDLDTGLILQTFGYDSEGSLLSITDQSSNETTIQYDGNGVALSITSPNGLVTGLTVDGNNHLTGINYPDGGSYSFTYDVNGLLQTKTEPAGNGYIYVFDGSGRLLTAADEEGGLWNYSRTSATSGVVTTRMTSAESSTTTYIDSSLISGESESTISYPSGNNSTTTWSVDGLTQESSLACGMTQTSRYNIDTQYQTLYANTVTSVTPAGLTRTVTTSRTYEDTDTDGVSDRIRRTVDTNGKSVSLEHDTLLSQEVITTAAGRTSTRSYDPATLRSVQKSVPGIHPIEYAYDAQGRLISLTQDARSTLFGYNIGNGFMSSRTLPGGQIVNYGHDLLGRTTRVTLPGDNHTDFSYDANGNLTTVTTPNGDAHTFSINNVNKASAYTLPGAGGAYSFGYDKERRLTGISFPSTGSLTATYTDNRLTSSQTSDGVTVNWNYVSGNKIQSATRGTDSVAYTYDGKLLLSATATGTLDQSLVMTYNNDFLLASLTYADASQTYSYDDDGLLIAALTGAATATITRNADTGQPLAISDGVLSLERAFNDYGEGQTETATVNSIAISSWDLGRDVNGRIISKVETVNSVSTDFAYTYDDLGRLLTVSRDSVEVERYTYDDNGNRLTDHDGFSYLYDSQDRLTSRGTATYSYSADGFLQSKIEGVQATSYTYSLRGELLGVIITPDVTIPAVTTIIDYTYGPLGRRIAKTVAGEVVEKYLWGGNGILLATYDKNNNLLIRFNYAGNRGPYSMNKGGIEYYLIYNYTGSLMFVTDADGLVVKSLAYDAFGRVINDSAPIFSVPLGFAGGLSDKDTGLVNFSARDYDPIAGRWTAKDPMFFAGGSTNLYAYVGNNPINFIDPLGKVKVDPSLGSFYDPLGTFIGWVEEAALDGFEGAHTALLYVDREWKKSQDPCTEEGRRDKYDVEYDEARKKYSEDRKQAQRLKDLFNTAFSLANDLTGVVEHGRDVVYDKGISWTQKLYDSTTKAYDTFFGDK